MPGEIFSERPYGLSGCWDICAVEGETRERPFTAEGEIMSLWPSTGGKEEKFGGRVNGFGCTKARGRGQVSS